MVWQKIYTGLSIHISQFQYVEREQLVKNISLKINLSKIKEMRDVSQTQYHRVMLNNY